MFRQVQLPRQDNVKHNFTSRPCGCWATISCVQCDTTPILDRILDILSVSSCLNPSNCSIMGFCFYCRKVSRECKCLHSKVDHAKLTEPQLRVVQLLELGWELHHDSRGRRQWVEDPETSESTEVNRSVFLSLATSEIIRFSEKVGCGYQIWELVTR